MFKTAILALCASVFTHSAAEAQLANCALRGVAVDRMLERFGETPKAIGLTSKGALLELFASEETGTWTVILTSPQKVACVVSSGTMFEIVATEASGEPM